MYTLFITIHIIISIVLIGIVLIQSGKGSSLSNVFGGGGMETVFGAETPAALNKLTVIFATLFMVSSLFLTIFGSRLKQPSSAIEKELKKIGPPRNIPAQQYPVQTPVQPVSPQKK